MRPRHRNHDELRHRVIATTRPTTCLRMTARTAFTLIEVIVVIVLLSVVGGVMTVRLSDNLERRGETLARQAEALLETLAHRQLIGQSRVALVFDPADRYLFLETLLYEESLDGEIEEANQDDEAPTWRIDPLTPVLEFDDEVTITGIALDGVFYDEELREMMPLEDVRPVIEIFVAFGDREEVVQLLPHEIRPARISGGLLMSADRPEPIDLDATGESELEW